MEAALRALNSLVERRLIENYAIGGAIGASFYLPAMQTEDIDAFVCLPAAAGPLVSLTPVYEALKTMGGEIEREYVRFGNWPVQILTDANALMPRQFGKRSTPITTESRRGYLRPSISAQSHSRPAEVKILRA